MYKRRENESLLYPNISYVTILVASLIFSFLLTTIVYSVDSFLGRKHNSFIVFGISFVFFAIYSYIREAARV